MRPTILIRASEPVNDGMKRYFLPSIRMPIDIYGTGCTCYYIQPSSVRSPSPLTLFSIALTTATVRSNRQSHAQPMAEHLLRLCSNYSTLHWLVVRVIQLCNLAKDTKDKIYRVLRLYRRILSQISALIGTIMLTEFTVSPIDFLSVEIIPTPNSDKEADSALGIQKFESF